MQHPPPDQLRPALQSALQQGTCVVLATVSPEDVPSTAFCSWVAPAGTSAIAVALDSRSTAYRNIDAGSLRVALEVLADDMILSVRGEASILKRQLRSVPFPCALVTVSIADVRDHGVDGVIFHPPRYLFADGKEHRGEVERTIFDEIAEAANAKPTPE